MDNAELDTLIVNLRLVAEVASLPSGALAMSRHDYVYAADALTALRAERDALAKDAARYRWLCKTGGSYTDTPLLTSRAWNMLEEGDDGDIDAAIDAAMQAESDSSVTAPSAAAAPSR